MSELENNTFDNSDSSEHFSDNIAGVNYEGDQVRGIIKEMETSYLDYAMSVIVQRALPDVRDGMKPVHRRIMYSMYDSGLRSSGKHRKSAKVVGDVLANYHPHGDSSVYDAMVRLAQNFSLRYPLIDGQGNFGSMDGDNAAAMRYTEAKMAKLGEWLLTDIDKNTVDWRPNYDASREEPVVLPARIPNLLLNGTMGIAVGMATNIPPHNLNELVDALQYLILHSDVDSVTIEQLLDFIKWPDFPTGWIIYNKKDILQAYTRGRGSVVVRGKVHIEEMKNSRSMIVIDEIAYQLNKKDFIQKIANLVNEKIIVGVADIRDESNKEWVRVVIELKRDAFPKKILNQLYKLTPLQTTFSYNMIALTDRGMQPKLMNLKEMLLAFVDHRKEVTTRRVQFELDQAEARKHILEGLAKAISIIDEIIKTIRASRGRDEGIPALMNNFDFSEKQATAIWEMQLGKLSGLEIEKIENELAEKIALIADLNDILQKPERVSQIISDELAEIKEKYGDERKTEVHSGAIGEFNPTDTIPNEDVVITLSKNGYIKRVKISAFRTQRRGGKGIAMAVKDEDEMHTILSTKNHNKLWFFTNTGRVFEFPTYEIPEMQRTAKGQPVVQFLALTKDETVATIIDSENIGGDHLVLISRGAVVKRITLEDIANIRSNGLIVMKPKDGDSLGWVRVTDGSNNILLVSEWGKAIQFPEEDVRVMGRTASGVRGMKVADTDALIEWCVVSNEDTYIFTISETGMGKISSLDEYREQGRGGSGIKVGATTTKTGKIIAAFPLSETEKETKSVILISRSGQTVRLPLKDIRITGRTTQWVILAKLKDADDTFTSATLVEEDAENEESSSDTIQE